VAAPWIDLESTNTAISLLVRRIDGHIVRSLSAIGGPDSDWVIAGADLDVKNLCAWSLKVLSDTFGRKPPERKRKRKIS
jgi:hypothetical protein